MKAEPIGKAEESASSADPLYIYYRSMSKIPLLTREQEVYLAKKIESAKLNTLRLLSLTTINTYKIMELAEELQPVGAAPVVPMFGMEEKRETENDVSLEERTKIRLRKVRRILSRLEKLEEKYRLARKNMLKSKARTGKSSKDLTKIKSNREAIFNSLQRIDFSENQIGTLIGSVEEVLHEMEEAQKTVKVLSQRKDSSPEGAPGSPAASERTGNAVSDERG